MGVFRGLSFPTSFLLLLALVVLNLLFLCNGGTTSTFVRKVEKGINMSLESDVFAVPSGYNAPQQVHITQGDLVGKAVIVSWVTEDEPGSNAVRYWNAENSSKQKKLAEGKIVTYKFFNYSSGFIHHTTIRNLKVLFLFHHFYVMYIVSLSDSKLESF
jgi:hypothetical protein